jgi:hypothetical protein
MEKMHLMTVSELEKYESYCVQNGNLQAVVEIHDFRKLYGKHVTVVKGR